jgi:hypothetical protein
MWMSYAECAPGCVGARTGLRLRCCGRGWVRGVGVLRGWRRLWVWVRVWVRLGLLWLRRRLRRMNNMLRRLVEGRRECTRRDLYRLLHHLFTTTNTATLHQNTPSIYVTPTKNTKNIPLYPIHQTPEQ